MSELEIRGYAAALEQSLRDLVRNSIEDGSAEETFSKEENQTSLSVAVAAFASLATQALVDLNNIAQTLEILARNDTERRENERNPR